MGMTLVVHVLAAVALSSFASAQTLDRAKQLFSDARYAEAKTELLALQKTDDRNPAVGTLNQYLATPPVDVDVAHIAGAHYWLGQIAEKRGQKDVARDHYRVALRINPNSQVSERALKALK
jgi:tetratricopeptide (TPR) repeat protein